MVQLEFLIEPQQHYLSILTWNINGARTKLEKCTVLAWICQYDIVSLNEIKTDMAVSLPGYVGYRNTQQNLAHRGGTVVFVKNHLSQFVSSVDLSVDDQVWLKLDCVPTVLFGFCYVPPSDSPYFTHYSFAAIHERIVDSESSSVIIIGDLNTRFGASVRNVLRNDPSVSDAFTYPIIPDNVVNPNDNALVLSTLCKDNDLLVINNLKSESKHFVGGKTYKKKDEWVSELDVVVASRQLISEIVNFEVHQTARLPSDHAPVTLEMRLPRVKLSVLDKRASMLGGHYSMGGGDLAGGMRRPLGFRAINVDVFSASIPATDMLYDMNDVNKFNTNITDALYNCAKESYGVEREEDANISSFDRWERLLREGDHKRVWEAINWKGNLQAYDKSVVVPSDEEFKEYFENMFNSDNANNVEMYRVDAAVTIPLLDDPITSQELAAQVARLKPDKACGPDGIPPGIFRLLPANWIICITTLFNLIFSSGSYPALWSKAKFFAIFKRGDRRDPSNYRGINVMNSIAKLYDMVLCCRLEYWFKPYREQAGAQRGRGCIEHILTLRLLTDYARKKKQKLFVTFVDFSKAYDNVPRDMLMRVLRRLGCGAVMLGAIAAMYAVTESVLGTAVFTTMMGVRQGSPTSCLLFIIFVNDLIKAVKENCEDDGFLSWLHILVMMDDTVLLATTRERMLHKIGLMKTYCDNYGMKVNETKTKFFVVGGNVTDREPLQVAGMEVQPCEEYSYLGSTFTADGSLHQAVRTHASAKTAHVVKFVSFLKKNNDIPFIVKKRVFDAALMSAVLYGCESWLSADLKPITKMYNWALKTLLDVRMTTCNDVCYIESGNPPIQAVIKNKQRKFLRSIWRERAQFNDDPLILALRTAMGARYNTKDYVQGLINMDVNDVDIAMTELRHKMQHTTSSRRKTYLEINPSLCAHSIYLKQQNVPEKDRIAFTRFRVSSHSLAVEVGRWNRRGRGRLPLEERVCVCGDIQTEVHVVQYCTLTQNLRDLHGFSTIQDIFNERFSHESTCSLIRNILDIYC